MKDKQLELNNLKVIKSINMIYREAINKETITYTELKELLSLIENDMKDLGGTITMKNIEGCKANFQLTKLRLLLSLLNKRETLEKKKTDVELDSMKVYSDTTYGNTYIPTSLDDYVNKTKEIIHRKNINEIMYEDNLHCSAITQYPENKTLIHSTLHKNPMITATQKDRYDYHYGIKPSIRHKDIKDGSGKYIKDSSDIDKLVTAESIWMKPDGKLPYFAHTPREILESDMLSSYKENQKILEEPLEKILKEKYNQCKRESPGRYKDRELDWFVDDAKEVNFIMAQPKDPYT